MGLPRGAGRDSFQIVDTEKLFSLLPKGEVLLDAGCGPGSYCIKASSIYRWVIGLDLWTEGLKKLKKRAEELGIRNIYAVKAHLGRSIPIASQTVDLCIMVNVLHDLNEEGYAHVALKEIARVVKRGGYLGIVEFHKRSSPIGPPMDVRLEPSQVKELAQRAGFIHEKTLDVGEHHYLVMLRR